ncbi:hypothetical protein JW935_26480 [candidate division KSB1 bacterium]|nr:hypothetical protein [candidate division KSB1 bacterium]
MSHKLRDFPETELLILAAEALKKNAGIAYTIKPGKKDIDTYVLLEFPGRRIKREFAVEIVRNPGAGIMPNMNTMKDPCILVTNYVNPNLAERFRNQGIQFIDCAGNAYINAGATFLFLKGNKMGNALVEQPAHHFKPSGLQILFTLLCNPDLLRAPYRNIATKAGVALGTVAGVIRDLKTQGYIIAIGKNIRRLMKKDALLRLWLVGYEQLLRPRLLIKRYHADRNDWWLNANLEQGYWGGEVAAYKLTNYLKPEMVTLYATRIPEQLILENKFRLDPNGEIEIMEPFWNFDYPEKKDNLAPPLLVYADLIIRADGRTTETAKMIYERYLARYFKED